MKNYGFKMIFVVLMLMFSVKISAQKINAEYSCDKQPTEFKKIFQKNGKIFAVVDMYQIVEREPSVDFINKDKKLRTFEVSSSVEICDIEEAKKVQGTKKFLEKQAKIKSVLPLISVKNGKIIWIDVNCFG